MIEPIKARFQAELKRRGFLWGVDQRWDNWALTLFVTLSGGLPGVEVDIQDEAALFAWMIKFGRWPRRQR